MNMPHPRRKGQTAIEYMILLGVVVALVLIAFKTQLPRMEESANLARAGWRWPIISCCLMIN